jgi:autotransporter strand-loop-strand O-heptosyltransferase
MKLKLMYVVPHLSTGGMPQFVLKRIESLQKFKNEIEIYLVEYSQFSTIYLVQRNKIIELLGKNHFFSLGSFTEKERKIELIKIIKKNNIDIVHFEEVPEGFESFNRVPLNVLNEIYNNSRTYKIVESCHNIWYDANNNKNFEPDYYCFVTPYHLDNLYNKKQSPKKVITYPLEDKVSYLYHKNKISKSEHKVPLIEKLNCREELGLDLTKTHILNVGLWTEGKNQKEGIEVARILEKTHPNLQFHFVGNKAENFEYYWGPLIQNLPSNVTIWGERNDVEKFMVASDVLMFNSLIECNPLVVREAISYGLKILTRNLSQYMGMFDNYIAEIEFNDYNDISNKLLELVDSKKTYTIKEEESFGNQLFKFYNKVMDSEFVKNQKLEKNYRVNQHFVVNPFIEIVGESESKFEITFYDEKNNIIYNNNLEINSWVKLNREYFTKWRTEIKENGDVVYSNILNLENKRVYISFGSKSLGDTLAWMPYCEEFRKKHNCELIVSTFLNSLFVDQYPEIEFVEPGKTVYNIYAQYQLGWFYNENEEFNQNRHPNDFKLQPLQKTATDILGLNYEEIRPKLNISKASKKKKVGIGFHSTAQAKYWNNKNGWQEVVDYLNSCGYECMIYSKEGNGYMGNNYPKGAKVYKGGSLQEVINEFATCEFFVGLGSGLSWLAWACELPVVLISGFSEKWAETKLDTYRVINEDVCHGCFNWDRLDAGDWNWCPKYKGTNRQFECSKQITSEMVINEINKIINPKKNTIQVDDVLFDWGTQNEWYIKTIKQEIFEERIYEKFFEVEEGDIVLDIGASLGPFTYSVLSKNPKHVFCFEPCEEEFPTLVKNTIGSPVTHIMKGISDSNYTVKNDKLFNSIKGMQNEMESITFKKFIDLYGIHKIDFLKTDCEGGEYDIFTDENYEFIKNNVKKIAGEWHLNENYYEGSKKKFRKFRDNYLKNFPNHQVFSVDGVDIKWDLWNEHFLDYYNEIIIYIDNR